MAGRYADHRGHSVRWTADVVRDYAPAGEPVLRGVLAVGDAWVATNPFLGRGLSLGAIQATVLRDAVADAADHGADAVCRRHVTMLREQVEPYVRATVGSSRHRAAQPAAEAAGRPYRTDDRRGRPARPSPSASVRTRSCFGPTTRSAACWRCRPTSPPTPTSETGWVRGSALLPTPPTVPAGPALLDAIERRGVDLPDMNAHRTATTPTGPNPLQGALS
jgi:hypothetical protein